MDVSLRLKVNCGCGNVTEEANSPASDLAGVIDVLDKALEHAAVTGHTLHLQGEVKAMRSAGTPIAQAVARAR